jgi:glutamate-1-semialdehyde 2,1-aminomutase
VDGQQSLANRARRNSDRAHCGDGQRTLLQFRNRSGHVGASNRAGGHRSPQDPDGAFRLPRLEFEIGYFDGTFDFHGADTTYLGTFSDAESLEEILTEYGSEIAAVFLEPVMGAGGVLPATPEFLRRVRKAAHAAGALFVLDEVITFRLSTGGVQSELGIDPDLTMLGKLIGGGFPVGAVGGKRAYMNVFDRAAPKRHHSGTFAGNPVTMAAGSIAVRELTRERIERMAAMRARLDAPLKTSATKLGLPISINRSGSLMNIFFQAEPPTSTELREDNDAMTPFYLAALNHGLLMAPRCMIALSTVMDEALIDNVAERAAAAMADVAAELA